MTKVMADKISSLKSQQNLSVVVSDILGFVVQMKIEIKTDRYGKIRAYTSSEIISGEKMLGICKFIIKELEIGSFGHIWDEDGNNKNLAKPFFILEFGYKHPRGGSNSATTYINDKKIVLIFHPTNEAWEKSLV